LAQGLFLRLGRWRCHSHRDNLLGLVPPANIMLRLFQPLLLLLESVALGSNGHNVRSACRDTTCRVVSPSATASVMLLQHSKFLRMGALGADGAGLNSDEGPAFNAGQCGDALLFSAEAHKFHGEEIRTDGGLRLCEDCVARCYLQMSNCVGANFEADGTCTYFSSIDEIALAEGFTAVTKTEHARGQLEPTPTSTPTPMPTPTPTQTPVPDGTVCYGELPALALEEGTEIGVGSASSRIDCERSCNENPQCKSISFCPSWSGCWLKDRPFTGGEASGPKSDCKTLYKTSDHASHCPSPAPGPAPEPAPEPAPGPAPPAGVATIKVVSYNLFLVECIQGQSMERHTDHRQHQR